MKASKLFGRIGTTLAAATLVGAGLFACSSSGGDELAPGNGSTTSSSCGDPRVTFESEVFPTVLGPKCSSCHSSSGPAKGTRLVIDSGNPGAAYDAVVALLSPGEGGKPVLVSKAVGGLSHGGGAVLGEGSDGQKSLEKLAGILAGKCEGGGALPAQINQRILRRLSPDEYGNSIEDLVGLPGFKQKLPAESRAAVFDNGAGSLRNDTEVMQAVLANAQEIASSPALRVADLAKCTAQGKECAKTFLDTFGTRVFRRPLSPAETARYLALYDATSSGGHEAGLRALLRGLLGSPSFLFRSELGTKGEGGVNVLTPYEVAAELSYLFWATTPDATLLEAAKAGKLGTKEEIIAQARRLLASPRAMVSLGRFADQWLNLDLLADKAKDEQKVPGFTPEVRTALRNETRAFFTEAFRSAGDAGTLRALLTTDRYLLSEAGAKIYGVPWEGEAKDGLKSVVVPGRSGILTQASLLALGATATEPVAILRGKLVRTRLLCQEVGEPPASAASVTASLPPPKDNRERFEQLKANPSCSGCHTRMDPIGLGYEGFDAAGRSLSGRDTSGQLLHVDGVTPDFKDPSDLHTRLAESAAVQSCFVKLMARYAYGVADSAESETALAPLTSQFGASGTRLDELLLALTQTDHFTRRAADPEEEAEGALPSTGTAPSPGTGGASTGAAPAPAGPSTPGIVLEPQPGYENGKEEGPGNWWIRGMLRNTTTAPLTGWTFRMPSPGTFKASTTVAVTMEGKEWVVRAGNGNGTLEPMRGYYVEMQFSK